MRQRLPRTFVRLAFGQGVSLLGDSFRFLTLMLWVYDAGDRAAIYLSLAVLAQMVPQILLGPVAGAITDRADKIKTIIAADLTRFVLGIALLLFAVFGNVAGALVTVALASAASSFAQPAVRSAIHQLVEPESLTRANGIFNVVGQVCLLVGPASAAIAYTLWGPVAALSADAASYLVAALAVRGMTAPPSAAQANQPARVVRATAEGLRYVAGHAILRTALFVYLGVGILAGINETVLLAFVSRDLGLAPGWVGTLTVTNGIIQATVGGVIIAFAARIRTGQTVFLATGVMAVGAVVMSASPNLPVLILAAVLIAAGNMPFSVAMNSIQQTVPREGFSARVVGAFESAAGGTFILAALLAGVVADRWSPRVVLAASAVVMLMTAVLSWRLRETKQPQGHAEPPALTRGDQEAR